MKRFHVHVAVDDLDRSIAFYTTLFGAPPSVAKRDYAKWMLDDPRVNFAISTRGRAAGLDHLGIQVESQAELNEVSNRLAGAELALALQSSTTCCYATSDKAWVRDPQNIAWETFFTTGTSTSYGADMPVAAEGARLALPASPAKASSAARSSMEAGACCEPGSCC